MYLKTYKNPFKWLVSRASFLAIVLILMCVGRGQSSTLIDFSTETIPKSCQNTKSQNIEQLIDLAEVAEYSQQDYAEAERLWREIIQLEPDYVEAYEKLGFILYRQGLEQQNKLEQAAEVYRQAIQRHPEAAENHYGLATVLLAQQKLSDAIASYHQVIQLEPSYAFNVDWFRAISLEQSILTLTQEIETNREFLTVKYLLLGDALRQARRSNEAMDSAQHILSPACQAYLQGCTERYVVTPDQELNALQAAIQFDPQSAVAYESLGVSLYQLGNYDEAVLNFKQAIQLDSQSARVYYRLGDVLMAQGKTDEALQTFYQAVQAEPHDTGIDSGFWWLGIDDFGGQSRDKAITALQQKLQNEPSAVGYYLLGNALVGLHLMGNQPSGREQAIAAFQQAIQLEPMFAKAQARLGYVLMFHDKQEEAEQALRQAIQLDPTLISAYDTLESLLRNQQRFAEAEQVFCNRQSTN